MQIKIKIEESELKSRISKILLIDEDLIYAICPCMNYLGFSVSAKYASGKWRPNQNVTVTDIISIAPVELIVLTNISLQDQDSIKLTTEPSANELYDLYKQGKDVLPINATVILNLP